MYLSKKEALTVAKLLAIHDPSMSSLAGTSDFQRELDALRIRVDAELTKEDDGNHDHGECGETFYSRASDDAYGSDEYDDDEEEDDDEENEEDEEDPEDSAEEEDEEDDEESGEDDESSEEDDDAEEEDLHADLFVTRDDLDDLVLKTKAGTITFDFVEDEVDLLLDGHHDITITHMKRFGQELHVRGDGGRWSKYQVKRFPKAWVDLLPVGVLVEVGDEDE